MLHESVQTRIGLIGASFETGNMGVGALAAGAIRCIHTQWPGAEIFILDYAKKDSSYPLCLGGEVVEVRLLNMRFSKKLYLSNNIAALIVIALVDTEYGVTIKGDELRKIQSVQELYDMVIEKQKNPS